jgi:hypothetical protein
MIGDIQRFSQNSMEISVGCPSMREKPTMHRHPLFRVFQRNGCTELRLFNISFVTE